MTAHVIGLLGSPLTGGNTAILLDRALQGAADAGCTVEKIEVTGLDFQACMELMFCADHETCIMDDAMQEMYPKFRDMDSLIIATPVMTLGIPGKLKSFMDRFQVFFMAKYVRKQSLVPAALRAHRNALVICISGMNIPEVFVGAKMTIRAFLDLIDCRYADELLVPDMDPIRDIRSRQGLLDAAYAKGKVLGEALVKQPAPAV